MPLTSEFFIEIDRRWPREPAGKVRLSIIGSGALMLQADYERGTKDSDVFETMDLTGDTKRCLVAIAGPDTDLHRRRFRATVGYGVPALRRLGEPARVRVVP